MKTPSIIKTNRVGRCRSCLARGFWLLFSTSGLLFSTGISSAQTNFPPTIAAGYNHTLAANYASTVFAAGLNANGELGDGSTNNRTTLVGVTNVPTGVVAVSGGALHSLILLTDRSVRSFGNNGNGRLGDNTTTQRLTNVAVVNLTNVLAIAAGGSHNLALISDGTVRSFGYNAWGRLGDGSNTERHTNVVVVGLSNVMAIAAGDAHSLALLSNGTVAAFGYNAYGQLGINSTVSSSNAVVVTNLTSVAAIAAGNDHSFAVLCNSTVRAWGWNGNGRLGDGSTTERNTNVVVTGLSNVVAIAGGAAHSLALLSDGTVRSWGLNSSGQLGDGTITERHTNVVVTGLSNVIAIAAGTAHSIALKSDGTIWIWGYTNYGLSGGYSTVPVNPEPAVHLSGAATPSIVAQPQSQTLFVGSNVTFSVSASGSLPLSYQWQLNGANISGATGTNYTKTNVQVSDSGGSYSVVVTNFVGSVTSSNALLSVFVPPLITRQPQSQSVYVGETAAFRVSAIPQSGTLSYQWFFNGVAIDGATDAVLVVDPSTAGSYSVQVSDANSSVMSAMATLTDFYGWQGGNDGNGVPVLPPEGDILDRWLFNDTNELSGWGSPPMVVSNVGCIASWSSNALVVDSTNSALLQYPVAPTNADGSVFTELTCDTGSLDFWFSPDWSGTNLGGTGPGSAGRLIELGAWTNDASLGWWSLYLNPEGTKLTFSAQAGGVTTNYLSANIAWASNEWYYVALTYSSSNTVLYIDGQEVASGPGVTVLPSAGVQATGFRIGSDGSGLTQAHGEFENLWTFDYPLLDFEVSLEFSYVWPYVASWTPPGGGGQDGASGMLGGADGPLGGQDGASSPPVVTLQPTNQTVLCGNRVTFAVAASGTSPLSYQWQFNGVNIRGQTGSNYVIYNVKPSEAGVYSVVVANQAGSVTSSNAVLTVNGLCLEITGVTNAHAYLALHGTSTANYYQLLSKTNLADAEWSPGEWFYGNIDTVPVYYFSPVAMNVSTMFFEAESSVASLDLFKTSDAVRPAATNTNDPVQVGSFEIDLTSQTTADVTVRYRLSGTAIYGLDYTNQLIAATNGVTYTNLTGTVTIKAGMTGTNIYIYPRYSSKTNLEEPVTMTLLHTNSYVVHPPDASATVWIYDPQTNCFTAVVTNLNFPTAVDYHPPSGSLLVAVTPNPATSVNFVRIYTNLVVTNTFITNTITITNVVSENWSSVTGKMGEVKITTVKATASGFTAGDMFFGSARDTRIGWVSTNGGNWDTNWLMLPGDTNYLGGSLYVDQTGTWGGNLLAVTGTGQEDDTDEGVWQINSNKAKTQIARITTPHLEGLITLTNDTQKWGPWAGKIITGDESEFIVYPNDLNQYPMPLIYAIDTSSKVTSYAFGIEPAHFDLIPSDQDLYCTQQGEDGARTNKGSLLKVPRAWLTNHVGDLLITDAGENAPDYAARLYIVHWDTNRTNFVLWRMSLSNPVLNTNHLEHVSFAPIDLPPLSQ